MWNHHQTIGRKDEVGQSHIPYTRRQPRIQSYFRYSVFASYRQLTMTYSATKDMYDGEYKSAV